MKMQSCIFICNVPWDDCGRCQRLSGDFPVAAACMPTWRVGDGINRPYFILPTSLHASDFIWRHSLPVALATVEPQLAAALRKHYTSDFTSSFRLHASYFLDRMMAWFGIKRRKDFFGVAQHRLASSAH
jgi:hypothetical protein